MLITEQRKVLVGVFLLPLDGLTHTFSHDVCKSQPAAGCSFSF